MSKPFLPTTKTSYRDGELFFEQVRLTEIADAVGTPCYVYSAGAFESAYRAYENAFSKISPLICYSVKANSNLSVLSLFAKLGAGFDVVSGGELKRVEKAGGDIKKTVFSGVGKSADEIKLAIEKGILFFNVESPQELEVINEIATGLGAKAPISLRVNPNIDPKTHPYISTGFKKSKFGMNADEAEKTYERAASMKGIEIRGIDAHIGSQIFEISSFTDSLEKLLALVGKLEKKKIKIGRVDMGGGLGVRYDAGDSPPPFEKFAGAVEKLMAGSKLELVIEPGRSLAANAGLLLTRAMYVKRGSEKKFIVVDAAMNDLVRPAFYGSHHEIVPAKMTAGNKTEKTDIVGPVCESGDFFATDRDFPLVDAGELLAVMSAGAYCFTMSSNYNTRARAAEVLVKGGEFRVIRERESFENMLKGETVADFGTDGRE
ncbi:MAG: diaminopimelate decarboxylase [Candidatus Mycalebacterium zealandia]|nr:MAG: diaminopimelate decarboxylase [Candidatus Mycalebacterium zealandia]